MTSPSLPQAMSAERIEKAAEAAYERILANAGVTDGKWKDARPSVQELWRMVVRAALRAAYPELADGRSWIAPWEASEAMRRDHIHPDDWTRVRDAALSAPEST